MNAKCNGIDFLRKKTHKWIHVSSDEVLQTYSNHVQEQRRSTKLHQL